MNDEQFPIGIDLGTINSVLAVHRHNKTEIIQCQGLKITPSTVFYNPNENEVTVGDLEGADVGNDVSNIIHDCKRLIGRSYQDEWVQNNRDKLGFNIEASETNRVLISITQNGRKTYKTPQQVSSEILKVFKETASKYLGYEVSEAVITVPAYFTFSQRNATKQAANLAGLKVLMLLNEPTAACLHYIKEANQKNSLCLVFDLGGGTLDISVVRVYETGIKVVAVDGDTLLGGQNFDQAILDYICEKYKLTLDKWTYYRAAKSIEKMKHKLSSKDKVKRKFEDFNGTNDFKLELTRSEFEDINLPLFEKCISIIKRCLENSSIKKEDVENIILVGGATKIPKIQQMVEEFFNGKQVSKDLDPDETVACGAAIQAASMKGLVTAQFKIIDVTPFSLGTDALFNKMETIIKSNTPLPAENSKRFFTVRNYQTSMASQVYEGERPRCKLNNFLGEFTVKNLPRKPAGRVTLLITFSIDESGLLKVTAEEESTGANSELEVGIELHDLKSYNVVSLRNEIEEDKLFLKFTDELLILRSPCVIYICDKEDGDKDVKECKKFIEALENLEFEERHKLKGLVRNFKKNISDSKLIQEILVI